MITGDLTFEPHAAIALGKRDWKAALEALENARAVELGTTMPFEYGMMLPVWLRAVALEGSGEMAAAVKERARISERRGLVKNFVTGALAAAPRS